MTALIKNLGMQTVVNEISKKEKLCRKKYIGVLRWESSRVRRMMAKFPVTLNTYVKNRKRKTTIWNTGHLSDPKE